MPAHNEESVITRCLDTLAGAASVRQIVVVANSCRDRTAQLAEAHRAKPEVIETSKPGKTNALNLGDACCRGFPRAYLDADIELDAAGLDALAAALRNNPSARLAAPRRQVDTTHCSALVKCYFRTWQAFPAVAGSTAGCGVYVLSAEAHAKLFPLPEHLITDDGYVERSIPADFRVITDTTVVVRASGTVGVLLLRRVRVHAGNRQLLEMGVTGTGATSRLISVVRLVLQLVRARKVDVLDAAVFLMITLLARSIATWQRLRGRRPVWATDRSSR